MGAGPGVGAGLAGHHGRARSLCDNRERGMTLEIGLGYRGEKRRRETEVMSSSIGSGELPRFYVFTEQISGHWWLHIERSV